MLKNRKSNRRLRYFLAYTILYLILAGLLVLFFKLQNRSLVYHADAWRQHLRALAYYGKWLRGNLWHLLHDHSLTPQAWSFGLGYGSDVLTTLHYYCIGEPLAALTVFIPERFTKYYFEFLILLRPYLAGLSFSAYAEYMIGRKQLHGTGSCTTTSSGSFPILCGALCYVFSGTVLYLGMLHPFFVTPMIYLPLLLLGVEKVLRERKPRIFLVTVWLAALSNFYFFYMLALMTAVYALVRVIARTHGEQAIRRLLQLLGYAAAGTMAAGAVLIPILVQFQSDPRNATSYGLPLFYEKEYYSELLKNAVTFINHPLYDTELCLSVVCIAAVITLFFLRGHGQLKLAVIGAAVMLCLPAAGYVMNGGAYVINRWTFAVEFLFAFVLTVVWSDEQVRFRGKNIGRGLAFSLVLVTLALNIVIGYLRIPAGENGGTGQNGFPSEFADEQTAAEYMTAANRNESAAVTQYAAAAENPVFYRYTGRDLTYNAGTQTQTSSTQFCWSLANGSVADFFKALGVNEEQNFSYTGLDDRTALEALAGVKYYTIAYDNDYEKQFVPYGFADCGAVEAWNPAECLQEKSGAEYGDDSWEPVVPTYHIYQNTFALPIGYTYTGFVSRSAFDAMDLTERQEALLQGVVLEGEDEERMKAGNENRQETGNEEGLQAGVSGLEQVQPEFSEEKRAYTVEIGDGVSYVAEADDGVSNALEGPAAPAADKGKEVSASCFRVTKAGAKVTLRFEAAEEAETYLVLRDLDAGPLDMKDGRGGEDEKSDTQAEMLEIYPIHATALRDGTALTDKTLNYKTEINQYYSGWKDFAINMGYRSHGADALEITFQSEGVYSMSELAVVVQPTEEMMRHAVDRLVCTMTDVDLHRNPVSFASGEITGTVNAEQDRYLVFSIPYSKGWTVYDNGKKAELQKANLMYLGMPIEAGSHEIRLVYRTPGGTAGILVSLAGVILMVFLCRRSSRGG
ncbi:YfhO family protein [Bacillota bacterium LCP21S3_D9]